MTQPLSDITPPARTQSRLEKTGDGTYHLSLATEGEW